MGKRFSANLAKEEIEVEYNGTVTSYVVTELMGLQRDRFMDVLALTTRKEHPEKPGEFFESNEDSQARLIVECLRDKNGQPPNLDEVRRWGVQCSNGVFEVCQTVNGMNKQGQDAIKKDSPANEKSGFTS